METNLGSSYSVLDSRWQWHHQPSFFLFFV